MHLVTMGEEFTCTCRELQEMQWLCEHIMVCDDLGGRDFTLHFHQCWKMGTLAACYEHTISCFLDNDLDFSTLSCPPNIAVKRGRHRVVGMESAGKQKKTADGGDDNFMDKSGHLVFRYPINDDPSQEEPMARGSRLRGSNQQGHKKRREEWEFRLLLKVWQSQPQPSDMHTGKFSFCCFESPRESPGRWKRGWTGH